MSDWTLQRTISTMSGIVSGSDLPSDPTSDVAIGKRTAQAGAGAIIQTGIVIRSGVGSYDCTVRIGGREIGCQIAANIMSPTYGYSLGFVPPEGARVLVALPSRNAVRGIVLGFVPLGWMVTPNTLKSPNVSLTYSREKAGYAHYGAFQTRIKDKTYSAKVASQNHRPSDILHGEVHLKNDHACGFVGGTFSGTLQGGGAFVRASRVDDLIRLRSANYEKWTDSEVIGEYNDTGEISTEKQIFSYQGERLGDAGGLKASAPVVDPDNPVLSSDQPVIPHPRIKEFTGTLGDVSLKIVERPEQKRIPLQSVSEDPKDEAVLSSHIAEDGAVFLRSAGGIALERYDRIPSVRRIKKPYDPSGDQGDLPREPIKPFKYDTSDEAFRPLELFDALAWEQKGVYQRFDEQNKDFKTQHEPDLGTPKDDNNDPWKSTSNMGDNDKRRCGVYMLQNGGLVIRDAWGAEICFVGGNIYLNAPGSIIMTANKSVVSYANDTNVMKAKKVAAVESLKFTEIRGVKYTNIQGGYTGGEGGVLIESFGTTDQTTAPPGAGHSDSTSIHGITLKSESGVNIKGETFRVTADRRAAIACGQEGNPDGKVYISTGEFDAVTKSRAYIGTEKAALFAQEGQAVVVGSSAAILGSKGNAAVISNSNILKEGIPTSLESSPVSGQLAAVAGIFSSLSPKKVAAPYDWEAYKNNVCSQLGTSGQYGTDKPLDLQNGEFKMYSPYWHTMKSSGNSLLSSATPQEWKETDYPVYENCAWPGKPALDSGKFAVLSEPQNLENGYSKKRDVLSDSTKVELKSFSSDFRV